MAVSKRLRFEILRRDSYTCRYCGASAPDAKLTVDHVLPVALGGTDEPTNLVAACADCNVGKSSSNPDQPLVADVSAEAIRWARAMREAVARIAEDVRDADDYAREIVKHWGNWDDKLALLPSDFETMCGYWRSLGMPVDIVANAIDIAWSNERVAPRHIWRYVIGIMKNRIQQAEDKARELIESGDE